jgi:hypothetical protein
MDTRIAHLEKSFHENLCEESTGAENANSNVAHNNSAVVNTLGISRSARVDADNVWRPAIRIVPTEEVAQIESTRTSPAVMVKTRHMPGDTIRMHVCRGRESKTRSQRDMYDMRECSNYTHVWEDSRRPPRRRRRRSRRRCRGARRRWARRLVEARP